MVGYKNYIITMSGSGEIIFFKKKDTDQDNLSFNFLNTNFYTFIDIDKYYKKTLHGIRDITVVNDELFVSYVDNNSCDKLSILRGKINFNYIKFEKFFHFQDVKLILQDKTAKV